MRVPLRFMAAITCWLMLRSAHAEEATPLSLACADLVPDVAAVLPNPKLTEERDASSSVECSYRGSGGWARLEYTCWQKAFPDREVPARSAPGVAPLEGLGGRLVVDRTFPSGKKEVLWFRAWDDDTPCRVDVTGSDKLQMRELTLRALQALTPASLAHPLATALIWGGGDTPAQGKAWLESVEALQPWLGEHVKPGEGYPLLVASADVPGLKPGFQVVLLGLCADAAQAKAALQALKGINPGAYSRLVPASGRQSCPQVLVRPEETRTARVGKQTVVLSLYRQGEAQAFLLGEDGRPTARREVVAPGSDCQADFEGKRNELLVDSKCPVTGACNDPGEVERGYLVGVTDGSLSAQMVSEHIRSPNCDTGD